MKLRLSPLGVMLGLLVATTGIYAQTTELTILNPSFELQSSTDRGSYSTPNGITDWATSLDVTGNKFISALVNIPIQGWSGTYQGENAFEFFNYYSATGSAYIFQGLSSEFVPGDTYTLTADAAGNFAADFYIGTNYTPTSAVATVGITTGTGSVLNEYSVSFTATAAEAGDGIFIGFSIPVISAAETADTIDNFQLTQTVPTSSYLWSNAPADGKLNNPANWAGGVAVVANNTMEFATSSITTLNNTFTNDAPFTGLSFDSNASSYTISGNAIYLAGNTTTNNSSNNQTINVTLDGIGGVTQSGTGTLFLTASNSFSGGTTINAGEVDLSNSYALGSGGLIFASNSTLTTLVPLILSNGISLGSGAVGTINNAGNNITNSGAITGSGGINYLGPGTITQKAVNSYTGPTTLNGQTIIFSSNNPLGTGTLTVATSSALSNASTTAGVIPTIYNSSLNINSGQTLTVYAGTVPGTQSEIYLNSVTGAGTLSLFASSTNWITLLSGSGINPTANTYSGGTILNGGIIQTYNTSQAFGSGTITVAGNTSIRNVAALTVPNPIVLDAGQTLTATNPAQPTPTFSGLISGAGNFTASSQPGGNSVALGASNTYSGSTIISSGTLLLETDASIYGSTNINLGIKGSQSVLDVSSQQFYSIGTTQTLSGYGVINGPAITLNVNGHITPGSMDGSTRGLITINGNVTLGSNSATTLTLNNAGVAGTDYDSVDVSGFLNYGGQLDLIVNTPSVGTFDLFSAGSFNGNLNNVGLFGSWNTGSFTQGAGGTWTYTDPNNTYNFNLTPSSGLLQVISVPEPSTIALLGLSALALLVACRRRVA